MTCPYCHLFHAQNLPCEACSATATATKPTRKPKSRKSQSTRLVPLSVEKPSRKPPIDNILATLRKHGMATDTAILDGLRTGAIAQLISWQLQYEYLCDYLESKGLDIGSYRYRIVTGSGELERKLNAA